MRKSSSGEDKPTSPLAREPATEIPDVSAPPAVQPSEPELVVTDTVGRMSFAAEGCSHSGFTPEKDQTKAVEAESSAVESTKRHLGAELGAACREEVNGVSDGGSDGAEAATEAPSTPQQSLPRRGSSNQLATPKPK